MNKPVFNRGTKANTEKRKSSKNICQFMYFLKMFYYLLVF